MIPEDAQTGLYVLFGYATDVAGNSSEIIEVAEVQVTGVEKKPIDAGKPKVSLGTVNQNQAKLGDQITFCFIATGDKGISRVVGSIYSMDDKTWVSDATGSRRVDGSESAGRWCLDATIPTGKPNGVYALLASAFDSLENQSERVLVAEVEIIGALTIEPTKTDSSTITSSQTISQTTTTTEPIVTKEEVKPAETTQNTSTTESNTKVGENQTGVSTQEETSTKVQSAVIYMDEKEKLRILRNVNEIYAQSPLVTASFLIGGDYKVMETVC